MKKARDLMVPLAFVLALLLPVYFAVAALGTKFGLFSWQVGFGLMTYRLGGVVINVTLAVALLALLLAVMATPRRGVVVALVALMIPLLAMGYGYYVRSQSSGVPPIHDVTTDPIDPPVFGTEVMAIRAATAANPLDPPTRLMADRAYFQRIVAIMPERARGMADQSVAEIVKAAYSDIRPIPLAIPPGRAFELVMLQAQAQGWQTHLVDADHGLLNGTAQTFWFGFEDDVSVRVRAGAMPGTSVVDLRSISRVGGGDMGTNAERIRVFRDGLLRRAG